LKGTQKMRARNRIAAYAAFVLIMIQSLLCTTLQAGRHTFNVGDKMPEFSGTTLEGQVFSYKHNQNKALLVLFVSGRNKRSQQAANDVKDIIRQLGANQESAETVIAIDDPNGVDFSSLQKGPARNFHILLDSQYKLWGQFGIIATPTVIITDTNDNVICIRAGYGYDFPPIVKAYLNQALGLTPNKNPQKAIPVETVANDTIAARLERHLQMAKMLEQKNRLDSAISEVQKARQLDPNSTEAALALGELLCRTGRSQTALETVESLKVTKQIDKARLLMIEGWAKRQTGNLDAAEKLLLEATTLDPRATRAFFELGKVYQARQQTDKAMKAYHKALTIVFNEEEPAENSH
jgi:tetratricopeptide (TPR) repeat protein